LEIVKLKKVNGSRKRKIYNKRKKEVKIRKRRKENNSEKDDERNIQQKENIKSENENSDEKMDKVELLIKELDTSITPQITVTNMETDKTKEDNDIKRLILQYGKLKKGNRKLLKDWYNYGRSFVQNLEKKKLRTRKPEKEIKKKLYNRIVDCQMLRENERKNKKDALRKKTQRAIKTYELFMEIGNEKLERIRETFITTVIKLSEEQRKRIKKYFRKRK
jgi:hypothetical protein